MGIGVLKQLLGSCLMGTFVDGVTCHSYNPLSYPLTSNSNWYLSPSLHLSLSVFYSHLALSRSGPSHVLSVPKKCVNSSLIIFIQFLLQLQPAPHFHSLCLFVTLPVYCMFVCPFPASPSSLPSFLCCCTISSLFLSVLFVCLSTLASICFGITTIPGTQYLCISLSAPSFFSLSLSPSHPLVLPLGSPCCLPRL